ncbi:MAG: EamA family transporter [Burkholderiales bacterium]|nr:EamA family transporter [Anaerolineae bacterium]
MNTTNPLPKKGIRFSMGFLYIALTILLTVYGQIVLKWQLDQAGEFPPDFGDKLIFLFRQLLNPWVISSFASAFIASLTWMAAMTQFELSFAYPFMSLSFIIVAMISFMFLGETFTWAKVGGTLVIIAGLFLITR